MLALMLLTSIGRLIHDIEIHDLHVGKHVVVTEFTFGLFVLTSCLALRMVIGCYARISSVSMCVRYS